MLTSLLKEKGILKFIILAQLLPEYNFILVISNNIESIDYFIKRELKINKLPSNLSLYPSQSEIHSFLQNSDLLINLTDYNKSIETFGMTILEAMAYGIPAIVPNVGGPIELIKNEYNGFCIDVNDIDEIKRNIQRILSDQQLYNKIARNSLIQYKNKFKNQINT